MDMDLNPIRLLLFLGEALMDIVRPGPDQPLDEIGTFLGPFPAGAPANAADAAARMGGPVTFLGTVGDDAFGRLLRRRLEGDGVDVSRLAVASDASTGVAFASYRSNGSRSFVFHIGAAARFESWQCQPEDMTGVRYVHITGSSMAFSTAWQVACLNIAKWAKENGATLSMDPNIRPELAGSGKTAITKMAEWCDIFLPSLGEAGPFAGMTDEDEACRWFAEKGKTVIQKRSAEGCRVYQKGTAPWDVPTVPAEEVDPTGAGDAFAGGLLAALQRGEPVERAIRLASYCGARCVTKKGPMEGTPTWDEAIAAL